MARPWKPLMHATAIQHEALCDCESVAPDSVQLTSSLTRYHWYQSHQSQNVRSSHARMLDHYALDRTVVISCSLPSPCTESTTICGGRTLSNHSSIAPAHTRLRPTDQYILRRAQLLKNERLTRVSRVHRTRRSVGYPACLSHVQGEARDHRCSLPRPSGCHAIQSAIVTRQNA